MEQDGCSSAELFYLFIYFLQENTIWFSWDTIGKEAFFRVFMITTAMKKVSIQLNVLDGPISYWCLVA